jgi:hypothetical protein
MRALASLKRSRRRRSRLVPLALGVALASLALVTRHAVAESFVYASPTTFSTLNTGTQTTFGLADLTVTATRLSTFSGSNGLTLGSEVIVFPETNPSNPPWVAGTRDMFRLRFNYGDGSTEAGTVTVQYAFSSPLSTAAYLVFADFDVKETMKIRAYDGGDSLIPFGSLSFTRENGRQPGGASLPLPTWSSEAGYSGVIAYGNNPIFSGADPVVTVQSSIPISRLVYESDNTPYDTVANNDLYFNFAVPVAAAVPEIDPQGLAGGLALLGGALGLLERRRRTLCAAADRLRNRSGPLLEQQPRP